MLDGLSTWIFKLREVKKVEVEDKKPMAEPLGDQRGAIKNCNTDHRGALEVE